PPQRRVAVVLRFVQVRQRLLEFLQRPLLLLLGLARLVLPHLLRRLLLLLRHTRLLQPLRRPPQRLRERRALLPGPIGRLAHLLERPPRPVRRLALPLRDPLQLAPLLRRQARRVAPHRLRPDALRPLQQPALLLRQTLQQLPRPPPLLAPVQQPHELVQPVPDIPLRLLRQLHTLRRRPRPLRRGERFRRRPRPLRGLRHQVPRLAQQVRQRGVVQPVHLLPPTHPAQLLELRRQPVRQPRLPSRELARRRVLPRLVQRPRDLRLLLVQPLRRPADPVQLAP